MISERIGVLGDGMEVFNRHRSHVADDESLKRIIREALLEIEVDTGKVVNTYTHDFGKIIGERVCTPTVAGDDIIYAQRRNRRGLSRFVKGKEAEPTSKLTVVLMKNTENDEPCYILITAFYGDSVAKEPWDKFAEPNSKDFWNNHAFIWEKADILSGSVTKECPW